MQIVQSSKVIDLIESDEQIQHQITNNLKIYAPCVLKNNYVYDIYDPIDKNQTKAWHYEKQKNLQTKKYKITRCKICYKKILHNTDKIHCFNCNKSYHKACFNSLRSCPQCQVYNKQKFKPKLIKNQLILQNRKKPKILNQVIDLQINLSENFDSQSKTSSIKSQQILKLSNMPSDYQKQIKQFSQKYPKYLNQNGDLIIPIQDSLLNKYNFLNMIQKDKNKQIPQYQELPEYFQNLLGIWNTFGYFQSLIKPKQICKFNIQKFEEQIKANSISYFLTPFLEMVFQPDNKCFNMSSIFKILMDLKQIGMFKQISKYFWPIILIQFFKHYKNTKIQNFNHLIAKLQSMFEKRIYEVDNFEQKLQIIKFLIDFVQKSTQFRIYLNDCYKNKIEHNTKLMFEFKMNKDKIKQKQCQAIEKNVSKPLNIIKDQIKSFKQDKQTIQFLIQHESKNKIMFLGKDRSGKLYWYIANTQSNNIIFVSQTHQNNQSISQKWGFYHNEQIFNMHSCLNTAGINQSRLKSNIDKLISHKLINKNLSDQERNAKKLYFSFQPQKDTSQTTVQQYQINKFLKQNIKDISLSELRKLLLQTYKIFHSALKEQVDNCKITGYEDKIRNQKFKSLTDIKNFIFEFATNLYQIKNQQNSQNNQSKDKKRIYLWHRRANIYANWKKKLQQSNKNNQVFMMMLIFYCEVVYSTQFKNKVTKPKVIKNKRQYKQQFCQSDRNSFSQSKSQDQPANSQSVLS